MFEGKGIENNSLPALKISGMLLAGVTFATIGFFVENKNVNKWKPDKEPYRVNKMSPVMLVLCLVLYGAMCVV